MIKLQSFMPAETLKKYIRCYWVINGIKNGPVYKKTILPYNDVCMTFLITKNKNNFIDGQNITTGIYITPPSIKSYTLELEDEFFFVDISFYPGVFYELFKIPLNKLENRVYNIDDLSIKLDKSILEILYNKREFPNEINSALNNLFYNYFYDVNFSYFLSHIQNLCQNCNLDGFYENIQLSTRQIQREMSKYTGMNPKTIYRISRFYKVLEYLKQQSIQNYASIAHILEYYDQSHLIKDFKALSGLTLNNFLNESSNYMQYQSKEFC